MASSSKVTCIVSLVSMSAIFTGCLISQGWGEEENPVTNPLAGKSAAIQEGTGLFRANCSPCHGLNAKGGGRGPDLSANRWTHGSSDADIFRTIGAINAAGVGILLVEQNARYALETAGRAYVLQSGAILATGPVIENLETARLLGTSGLKPAAQQAALRGIADQMTVYEIP